MALTRTPVLVPLLAAAAAALAAISGSALAQGAFPERPLRLVVGFPAGGSTDVVARVLAARLAEGIGKPVLVENRPGAVGSIGAAEVVRAAPDGHTVLFQILTTAVLNPLTLKNLTYDGLKDLAPVAMVARVPNVLIVNKDLPARSVAELIALLKASPGKYNYGSSGTGGLMHLSGELFKQQAGVQAEHVPYKGSAPAMQEVIAGRLAFMFDNITGAIGPAKSGQVRLLGVTTGERVSILPEVPTIAESGLPQFRNASWFSLFTRSGVPAAAVARLESETIKAVEHPDVALKLRELGAIPSPMGAAQLDRFWKAEFDLWRPVVQGTKLD